MSLKTVAKAGWKLMAKFLAGGGNKRFNQKIWLKPPLQWFS